MDDLSRRMWLLTSAALFAGLAARRAARAEPQAQDERAVADFDSVLWDATGELLITQSNRERLTIEAEPSVIAKVVAEVAAHRLHIGFRPGSVQTQQPIRFLLEVKNLSALETRGSGAVHIGALATNALLLRLGGSEWIEMAQLRARALDVRLDGAGGLAIAAGEVERQKVVIAGAANYRAPALASRQADVAIDGSGEVRLAVSERLGVRIAGSGAVIYRGNPQVAPTVSGAGEIRREDDR
jgi:hypothetical protein